MRFPFFLLLLLPLTTFPQLPPEKQKLVDSLGLVLPKTKEDTQRVNVLNRMGLELKASDPDSALKLIHTSLILARKLKFPTGTVAALNQLGILYKNKAEHKKAIEALEEGIAIADKNNLKELSAKMSVNLGNIYQRQGNYEQALKKFYGALAFFEKSGNNKVWAGIFSNIGIVYSQMEDHPKSMEFYRKALAIRDTIKDKGGIANDHGNIAITFSYLWKANKVKTDRDSAYYYYDLSINGMKAIGDLQGVAHMQNNISELFIEDARNGNKAVLFKAENYLLEALQINTQIGDKSGIAVNYNSLATVYELKGDNSKAEDSRKKGYAISVEIGEKELSREMSYGLFTHYRDRKMYREAMEFHIIYGGWKDSVMNENNMNAMHEIEAKYETEKKEKEIELLTKKQEVSDLSLQKSQYFNWGLAIVSVLTLALLALYVNRFLSKKKTAQVLSKQNFEIQEQKSIIEEKNKDITDSIHYAGKIQKAILPSINEFRKFFPDSFVLFKPRDIVSGDFTWIMEKDGLVFFTAADCTGHGVPGALMSVMCSNALSKCVKELGLTSPAKILDKTVELLEEHFSGGDNEVMDGMDLAFCVFNKKKNELQFSGANNPLYLLQDGNLREIKGDKQPVGKFSGRKPFTDHSISLKAGDSLFIFTDGLADQFGGPKGKKFKNAQLREMLGVEGPKKMESFGTALEGKLREWQGSFEQVDDICVIGIRV